MTNQNYIHKYLRECEQDRKVCLKDFKRNHPCKKFKVHSRKWWTAWHRRFKSEQLKGE